MRMSDIELKHTWKLDRRSKMVRFYIWMWDASDRDVNFCKLFWGYVFMVPNLVVRVVSWPFVKTGRALNRRFPPPVPPEPGTPEYEAIRARVIRRRGRNQRILERIENAGVKVVWAFTALWRYARYVVVPTVGLAVLGGLTYPVYVLVTEFDWPSLRDILFVAAIAGLGLFGAAVAVLGLMALDRRGLLNWVPTFGLGVLSVVVAPILFFAWVMKMGFVSVKSNTCPRIELTDGVKHEPQLMNDEWG